VGFARGVTPRTPLEYLYRHFPWRLVVAAAALVLGLMIASGETGNWEPGAAVPLSAP